MNRYRDLIFNRIREDYLTRKEDSFLYQYMRRKNPRARNIHKLCTDRMYNLGYPLSRKKKSAAHARTSNAVLDMIDAFYEENRDMFSGGEACGFDPEPYQELLDALCRAGRTRAMIPVRVDALTGTGIYIMGRDQFKIHKIGENMPCFVAVMADWECECEWPDFIRERNAFRNEKEIALRLTENPLDQEDDECFYPNVQEANDWFEHMILEESEKDSGENARFGQFQDRNGELPDGVPKQFHRYFKLPPKSGEGIKDPFEKLDEDFLEETRRELELDA